MRLHGHVPRAGDEHDRRANQGRRRSRMADECGAGGEHQCERCREITLHVKRTTQCFAVDRNALPAQQVQRSDQGPDTEGDGPVHQQVLFRPEDDFRQPIALFGQLRLRHDLEGVRDEERQQQEERRAQCVLELLAQRIGQFLVGVPRHAEGMPDDAPEGERKEDQPGHGFEDELLE